MAYRTPGTGLIYGPLFQIGGINLVATFNTLIYIHSIQIIYRTGNLVSKKFAILYALTLIAYIPFCIFFHETSSDLLMTYFLTLWFYRYNKIQSQNFSKKDICIITVISIGLIAIRPNMQLVIMFSLPILITLNKKKRFGAALNWTSIYFLGTIGAILTLSTHNYIRYKSFSVSRGGNLFLPAYKLYTTGELFKNSKGESTNKLLNLINDDLLTTSLYKEFSITLEQFKTSKNTRMFWDLAYLSDNKLGWESNYAIVRETGIESIKTAPIHYLLRSLSDLFKIISFGYYPKQPEGGIYIKPEPLKKNKTLSEGQLIPYSNMWWLSSTPKSQPPSSIKVNNLRKRAEKLMNYYPIASPIAKLPTIPIDKVYGVISVIFYCLFVSFIFTLGRKNVSFISIAIFIFINLFLVACGIEPNVQYRIPYDFIVIFYVLFYLTVIKKRFYAKK